MQPLRALQRLALLLMIAIVGVTTSIAAPANDRDKDTDEDDEEKTEQQDQRRAAYLRAMSSMADCPATATASSAILDANNIEAEVYNRGSLFFQSGEFSRYEVPAGTGLTSIFASGLWIGGLVNGELHMTAATYAQGDARFEFFPGPLDDATGLPPTDCSLFDQVYKVTLEEVQRAQRTGELSQSILDWPGELGAPVVDGDGNLNNYNPQGGDLPKVVGDQTIWWVMNDAAGPHLTTLLAPLGIEVQGLAFAFDRANPLGNTTFYKLTIKYNPVEDVPIENVFLGLWSDPDLGYAGDDYVGSDTTLGMGFVYNGDPFDDGVYGDRPPALGYDFFQGPTVIDDGIDNDGDGLIDEVSETNMADSTDNDLDGQIDEADEFNNPDNIDNDGDGIVDETTERLAMEKFVYYNNDGSATGNPANGEDFYNYLRGIWKDGSPIERGGDGYNEGTENVDYMFPADVGEFWSEGNIDGSGNGNQPSDRRFIQSSGPFRMEPGEVQEIVFGVVWARAGTPRASVKVLKANDIFAQGAYDFDFNLPPPPDQPAIEVTELDQEIALSWSYEPFENNFLNSYDEPSPFLEDQGAADQTFTFEGYKIYQFRGPADLEGQVIATFDVQNGVTIITGETVDPTSGAIVTEVKAQGSDSGVQNFITIDQDFLGSTDLHNYTKYYYGVQAYAFNEASNPNVRQSPIARVVAVPSSPGIRDQGTDLNTETNAQLVSEQTAGIGGGIFTANVVDPTELTGQSYRLEIVEIATSDSTTELTYNLVRSDGNVILSGEEYFADTGELLPTGDNVLVEDGLSFTIKSPDPGLLAWIEAETATGIDPCGPEAGSTGGCPVPGNNILNSFNATSAYIGYVGPFTFAGEPAIAPFAPLDYEIRFTEEGSLAFGFRSGNVLRVPFEVWEVGVVPPGTENEPADDRQLMSVMYTRTVENGALVSGCEFQYGDAVVFGRPATQLLFGFFPAEGTSYAAFEAAYEDQVAASGGCLIGDPDAASFIAFGVSNSPVRLFGFAQDVEGQEHPQPGTVTRLLTTDPFVTGDQYVISTADVAPEVGADSAFTASLEAITAVPNPYRGRSQYDQSQFERQIRITNLPTRADIHIYSVNGSRIATIRKDNSSQYAVWNLQTEEGLPVASGMYLVHVILPESGQEKVVKLGVVRSQINLDIF